MTNSDGGRLLVLVDGSESSVAGEAVNVANGIALTESLERSLDGLGRNRAARNAFLFRHIKHQRRHRRVNHPLAISVEIPALASLLSEAALFAQRVGYR